MGEHGYDRARKQRKPTVQPVRPARRPTREYDAADMTGMLLQLQRTIGNQAVEQLLQRQNAERWVARQSSAGGVPAAGVQRDAAAPAASDGPAHAPVQRAMEAGGQPRIQRLMSFEEFKKATGQTASTGRRGIRKTPAAKKAVAEAATESWAEVLSGKSGYEALNADRAKLGHDAKAEYVHHHVYVAQSYGAVWVDINEAYEAYQADPSLATMITLYDRITYWQTMNVGRDWAAALRPTLEKVKQQIEADVQAETAKQAGGKAKSAGGMLGKAKAAAGSLFGKGGRAAKGGAAAAAAAMKPLLKDYPAWDDPGKAAAAKSGAMEPFLQEVGVAQGYYDEHLAGKPERIAALEAFYAGLKGGHLYAASSAYEKVSQVEGMYLIKPLFLSHFADRANLSGLVGTEAKAAEGKPVSAEELAAIKTYSGQAYEEMNAQLRGHTMRPSGVPRVGRQRMQPADLKQANKAEAQAATMRTAVAGLNKLPKFQGIAYRMSATVPPGYFAAIRAGGMLADLAFSSASPSMEGVGAFETTQLKGTESKSIYYMIHTRTAVNIVGLSENTKEGEVLFRPGTRFLVRAVWEHVNGQVPPGAPPQAQMILHYMGETKVSGMRPGGLRPELGADIGNDINRLQALMNQHPDASVDDLKAQILAEKAQEGKVTKVKVVELVEV